jgi:hypothetical protein
MDNFITGSSVNLNAKTPAAAAPKTSPAPAKPGVNPQEMLKTTAQQPISIPALSLAAQPRITGVKTFYAKLHGGSISFLDEQITNWLRDNPNIVIKRTNVVTGDLVAKNTEPNVIVTIWY